MVRIQPIFYEKVTAFKERMQLLEKINEIIDDINNNSYTKEQIDKIFEDYFTKDEIMDIFGNLDLTEYYTKTEINTLLANLDLSDYYNKTDVNNLLLGYYTKPEINLMNQDVNNSISSLRTSKQDVLTAGDNITIADNVISALNKNGWVEYDNNDWSTLKTSSRTNRDIIIFVTPSAAQTSGIYYIPSGTSTTFIVGVTATAISAEQVNLSNSTTIDRILTNSEYVSIARNGLTADEKNGFITLKRYNQEYSISSVRILSFKIFVRVSE